MVTQRGGITLIEILIALTIAALLLGAGLHSLTQLVDDSRSRAALNQMVIAITLARSSAISLRQPTLLCPGAGPQCGPRDSWHDGALLFLDENANGRQDQADTLLKRLAGFDQGRLYWRAFRNRTFLRFTPSGYTAAQNGSFTYCRAPNNAEGARIVILNAQGRTRLGQDSNQDGIVEDGSGRPAVCP
jgi:type IV fimbrial biogenesis protein FimT